MATPIKSYIIEFRIAWWFLHLYMPIVIFTLWFCRLFDEDIDPDMDKILYWAEKAIIIGKPKQNKLISEVK